MASLRKKGKLWYFRFTDADGVKRERRGCADRRVTEDMARAAESEAARIREGEPGHQAGPVIALPAEQLTQQSTGRASIAADLAAIERAGGLTSDRRPRTHRRPDVRCQHSGPLERSIDVRQTLSIVRMR